MYDISLPQFLLRLVGFAVAAGLHGFVLARTTRLLGDPGPRRDGRETPNPLPHSGGFGTASAALFTLPWIRALQLDTTRLHRLAPVAVAFFALAANLALAGLLVATRPFLVAIAGSGGGDEALVMVNALVEMNVWFVAFNVLPVPPLTAGLVWYALAPAREKVGRWTDWMPWLLFALLVTVDVRGLLRPWYEVFASLVGYG